MRFCFMHCAAKTIVIAGLAICGVWYFAGAAQACPMCSQSIAEENLLPHAYMYSIIFMLTMPAMVFTGIGSFIFFQYRRAAGALPSPDAADDVAPPVESRERDLVALPR